MGYAEHTGLLMSFDSKNTHFLPWLLMYELQD